MILLDDVPILMNDMNDLFTYIQFLYWDSAMDQNRPRRPGRSLNIHSSHPGMKASAYLGLAPTCPI